MTSTDILGSANFGMLPIAQDAAGQLTRSPFRFNAIGSQSPLLWLARKYAVLDGPTMPIVAEGDEEPNDTYVQQLTESAQAAIQVSVQGIWGGGVP